MRFEDERYVRLYTRDTTTWLMLPWQARAVLPLILRKVDRAGILDLGEDGLEALAVIIQVPIEVVEVGVRAAVERGTLVLRDGLLVWPRFIEGQESRQSDRARAKAARDKARDVASAAEKGVTIRDGGVTGRDGDVTNRDDTVTRRHTASHGVTPSLAVPSLAKPSCAEGVQGGVATPAPSPPPESGGDVPPPRRSRTRGRKPATALPADWHPKPEHVARLRAAGLGVAAVVEDFVSHWCGVGELRADWDATFVQNLGRIERTEWLRRQFAASEDEPVPSEARPDAEVVPLPLDEVRRQFGDPATLLGASPQRPAGLFDDVLTSANAEPFDVQPPPLAKLPAGVRR